VRNLSRSQAVLRVVFALCGATLSIVDMNDAMRRE
jgi:hypothetical protein